MKTSVLICARRDPDLPAVVTRELSFRKIMPDLILFEAMGSGTLKIRIVPEPGDHAILDRLLMNLGRAGRRAVDRGDTLRRVEPVCARGRLKKQIPLPSSPSSASRAVPALWPNCMSARVCWGRSD